MSNPKIKDNVLDGRCPYCGNHKKNHGELGCCPECAEKLEKLQKQRIDEGLCPQCGNPVYVDDEGKGWAVCHECLVANTKAMQLMGNALKELKRGDGC